MSALAVGMVPLLLLSYGLLYIFYTWCHPWLSEGVSLGFEPRDQGMWRHQGGSEQGGLAGSLILKLKLLQGVSLSGDADCGTDTVKEINMKTRLR